MSELPESFRDTLIQETSTFTSLPTAEAAELIRQLEGFLAAA